MDTDRELARLLRHQAGVISRPQVLAAGGDDDRIERMVRRRQWVRRHRGVYVDHTGEPTWVQRAWAAVLLHPVAALDGASALHAHGVRGFAAPDAPIEIVVPAGARVTDPPGVSSRRLLGFDERCLRHLSPPRIRLEDAALRVAGAASRVDKTVAVLGDVVQTGRTTAARLQDAALGTPRLPRRALILEVLTDLATGALSALERRYLRDVETAHGLPRGARQARTVTGVGVTYCDVRYDGLGVVVELDGRLGHSTTADRWDDLDRDLAAVVVGLLTLRAGWLQVLDPCRLARVVAVVLRVRGWNASPHPCARCRSPIGLAA